MRILRTTERYEAGWREQNFIPYYAAGVKDFLTPIVYYIFKQEGFI